MKTAVCERAWYVVWLYPLSSVTLWRQYHLSSSLNTHHHSLYIYNQSYHDIHSSISELLKCINKYCTPNMAYVFRASLVPEGTVSLIPFSFSLTNTWQPSLDLYERGEHTRGIRWELFGVKTEQIILCIVWLVSLYRCNDVNIMVQWCGHRATYWQRQAIAELCDMTTAIRENVAGDLLECSS